MKLGEFSLIEILTKKLKTLKKEVVLSVGDDTAVIKKNSTFLLLTVDALVENSHFRREWKKKIRELYYLLGRKLLSISLSDIAAMGGEAKYALVTLGVSESSKLEDLEALYKGLSDASVEYNVDVVGGDTVRSKGEFFDLFLLGESRKFMRRSEAKPGELVAVTGTFGDSKAGLELIEKGKEIKRNFLINRFLNPTPRLKEGKEAVRMGVKCGTDVSDGLIFNLYTIAESSKVSIFIDSGKIPMSKELLSFCKERKRNPLEYALFGGEDYELIITFPNDIEKEITALGFKVIGEAGKGSGVFLDGKLIPKKGFDHFRRE